MSSTKIVEECTGEPQAEDLSSKNETDIQVEKDAPGKAELSSQIKDGGELHSNEKEQEPDDPQPDASSSTCNANVTSDVTPKIEDPVPVGVTSESIKTDSEKNMDKTMKAEGSFENSVVSKEENSNVTTEKKVKVKKSDDTTDIPKVLVNAIKADNIESEKIPKIKKDSTDKVSNLNEKATPTKKSLEKKEKQSSEKKRKLDDSDNVELLVKPGKRDRKSSDAFKPHDFTNVEKSVNIINGRGKCLEDLEPCRVSIEKEPITSDILVCAHKLLFTARGKPNRKDMKKNLLKFSGFLSKERDPNPKKQNDIDMHEEAKMGAKAYKLKIPELKMLCDLFTIDRSKAKDKDGLVDALLDFLGEPKLKLLKGKGSSKSVISRKHASDEINDDDDDSKNEDMICDEDGSDEENDKTKLLSKVSPKQVTPKSKVKPGKMPSDDELRKWVNHYVNCHNIKSSTVKQALDIANDFFGVDLAPTKQRIKELLAEAL